jgi:hypothetical protein
MSLVTMFAMLRQRWKRPNHHRRNKHNKLFHMSLQRIASITIRNARLKNRIGERSYIP